MKYKNIKYLNNKNKIVKTKEYFLYIYVQSYYLTIIYNI